MKKRWIVWALCALLALPLQAAWAEEENYAAVAGEWLDEDGTGRLVIDENGFFTLTDENGAISGLLAFSGTAADAAENGEPWPDADWMTDGTRYVMYLDSGEPLPGEPWLLFDENDPAELVYLSEETARVYLRQAGAPARDALDVKVQWPLDALRGVSAYDEFAASQDPMAARLAFTAEKPVQDFKVLALSFDGVFDDGTAVFSTQELYSLPSLQPGRPLVVSLLFEGAVPATGISYVDDAGQLHRLAVDLSGESGEPYLWEFGI